MQQFSKYRIITVCFILMFIFAIAAIYTNTKDIVAKKAPVNKISKQQTNIGEIHQSENIEISDNIPNHYKSENEISSRLLELTDRIDRLERKVFSQANNSVDTGVNCQIQGISNDGHFVPMSDKEAINESRENNKEVVITCIFN